VSKGRVAFKFDGNLGTALLRSAQKNTDSPALWARGSRLTYRELFERAGGWAAALRRAGLKPGERVCILSRRSFTAYTGIVTALLAGCTYVPLNPSFPKDRNAGMVSASGASALLLDDQSASELEKRVGDLDAGLIIMTPESDAALVGMRNHRISRSDLCTIPIEHAIAFDDANPESPVYILFTSGTSGVPKGVPINHVNLFHYLSSVYELIPLKNTDRVLQAADLTFDQSVHDMFLTWLSGAELYSAPENTTVFAPRIIAGYNLTACHLVPSAAARASQQGMLHPAGMPSLRYTVFGGEALPTTVATAWSQAAPNSTIVNLYGPTEGTVYVSSFRIDPSHELDVPVVPIGWPLGSQKMALFDAHGREVAASEAGEIYLAGPQMMTGYWQAPELDGEAFVTIEGIRWYKTGDVGRRVDGYGVVFGGRADWQVKIRGYRVELLEIEGALRRISGRDQVAVIAWPAIAEGTADECIAFVVGPAGEETALQAICRKFLPPYMVPRQIYFITSLPFNQNGKIDYKALYEYCRQKIPIQNAVG
jgi:amino acid adenylation domain-containing protein